MTTTHVEALTADEAIALFERVTPGDTTEVLEAATRFVPGLTDCHVELVPATSCSAPASGARAVMLLGAAREVTCSDQGASQVLVPGDILVPGPGAAVAVGASDDAQDDAVLLVLT